MFYEYPGSMHPVSTTASETQLAKLPAMIFPETQVPDLTSKPPNALTLKRRPPGSQESFSGSRACDASGGMGWCSGSRFTRRQCFMLRDHKR